MTSPKLLAFLLASLALAVAPGPGLVYIVTRTLAQGRAAGLASVAGVALGNLGNAIGAALGLAALFAVAPLAFTVVKFAGVTYLLWLGAMALRAPPADADVGASAAPRQPRIFRDAVVVALLNPKTALFFVAFLPQFVDPGHSALGQSVLLGMSFVAIAAVTDTVYVLAASIAAPTLGRLRGAGRIGRWATAGTFIGLGLWAAAS
jgi:threonine/homoserine/homoserine lactone efflux protein